MPRAQTGVGSTSMRLACPSRRQRYTSPSAWTCLILATSLIDLDSAGAEAPSLGSVYVGDATFYGNFSGAGHCSFQFSGAFSLPWAQAAPVGVAMNHPQYAGSAACGMCVMYRGTNQGLGLTPISSDWQYAIVTDECPECKAGDLDQVAELSDRATQAMAGDGRWRVEWKPVQCNVGSSPFQYSFQGSNPWYLKMLVANTRVPIAAVQIIGPQGWMAMERTTDNCWLATGGPFTFPAEVRITSVLNDTVNDVIKSALPSGAVLGAVQFPASPDYAIVGQSITQASGNPASSPGPSVQQPKQTTLELAASGPPAWSLATIQPPPAMASPPAPWVLHVPVSRPVPTKQPAVAPMPRTTPRTTPPLPQTGLMVAVSPHLPVVAKHSQQCGGTGGACTAARPQLCADTMWAGYSCAPGLYCRRDSPAAWACTPLPPMAAATPAQGKVVAEWQQCGGGTNCSPRICQDGPWANYFCVGSASCMRFSWQYWQCRTQTS